MISTIRDRWRLAALSLLVSLVLMVAWAGGFAPLDQALRSIRFQLADRAPTGETVLVEIDAASLQAFGVWPWPRSIHAKLLDKLVELGAADIVFDIDFSTASVAKEDAALEAALERAGGYAFLAAFAQTATNGQIIINRPLDRFAAHADSVLVNVDGDGTRLLQSVPMMLPGEDIRSVAARLEPTVHVGNQLFIDFSIDLDAIDRISVLELLEGTPDPGRFYNKQVIIGASAVELRDFFRVPRFGVIPGPLVQIAATETLKGGRIVQERGQFVAFAICILLVPALFLGRRRFDLAQLTRLSAATSITVEMVACLALLLVGWTFDTVAVHFAIGLCLLMGLLEERSLRWNEHLRQQARMTYLATHDASTRAYSRQALVDQVNRAIASGMLGRISMVRLGRLDGAIAGLGHAVGENVAREVARRLEQHIGSKPARVGRDRFAWLHPDNDLHGLTAFSVSARTSLAEPYSVDGHVVVLDPLVGLSALGRPQDSAEELLRQAEVALVAATSLGSKTEIFNP
ncbi:MAG: CHASE2 domain-containing protein, partial [Devosia sp.]